MEEQVQTLLEKDEIIETINELFMGFDQHDWNGAQKRLAPEVYFDMKSLTHTAPVTLTAQEIVYGWKRGLKPLEATHHQTGNFIVKVTGNKAAVSCNGIVMHYLSHPSGRNSRTFVGTYDFHLEKKEERWLIDLFKFNVRYIDGNLNLEKAA